MCFRYLQLLLLVVMYSAAKAATTNALTAVADMLALDSMSDGDYASVSGYWSASDGGGGLFLYDSDGAGATNFGTVFSAALSGRWLRQYTEPVDIRWFGARTNGVDCRTYVQSAMSNNASVHVPSGDWYVDVSPFSSKTLFVQDNQVLQLTNDARFFCTTPATSYCFFFVSVKTNVLITGGTYVGYREPVAINNEWSIGHGVLIGSTRSITVSNVVFSNFVKNAVSIGGGTNITIDRITSWNCRQNASAITAGSNITWINSQLLYCNSTNDNDPMAGLDIEPNIGDVVCSVVLSNNTYAWNGHQGIYGQFRSSSSNFVIVDNTICSNGSYGISLSSGSGIEVSGNTCLSNQSYGIYAGACTNVTVNNNSAVKSSLSGIGFVGCLDVSASGNLACSNIESGMLISSTYNCGITNNLLSANLLRGLHVSRSVGAVVKSNTVCFNNAEGMLFRWATNATSVFNAFYKNVAAGSYPISLENTSVSNTINSNTTIMAHYGMDDAKYAPYTTNYSSLVNADTGSSNCTIVGNSAAYTSGTNVLMVAKKTGSVVARVMVLDEFQVPVAIQSSADGTNWQTWGVSDQKMAVWEWSDTNSTRLDHSWRVLLNSDAIIPTALFKGSTILKGAYKLQ